MVHTKKICERPGTMLPGHLIACAWQLIIHLLIFSHLISALPHHPREQHMCPACRGSTRHILIRLLGLAGLCKGTTSLRHGPKEALGEEAVQAVRHMMSQPQAAHRPPAEVFGIQNLQQTLTRFEAILSWACCMKAEHPGHLLRLSQAARCV